MKLSVLARELDGTLIGTGGDLEVSGVSTLQSADSSQICYYGNKAYRKYLASTEALAVITAEEVETSALNLILVEKPYHSFRKALLFFYDPVESGFKGIHESAVVHSSAELGEDVTVGPCAVIDAGTQIGASTSIGPGVVIGPGVSMGSECRIFAGVVIYSDCMIGDRVTIHSNAVIGSDGFGFVPDPGGHLKVPQTGNVVIEDDVELGAGCTIDRAVTGSTVIGRHSKLDNLVHIAHNVTIGPGTMLAAQTGIAGSSTLDAGVVAGGQVGITGHIHIGTGVMIGAQSGVSKNTPPGSMISGYPARPHERSLRINAAIAGLPEFRREVIEFMRKFNKTEEEQ